MPYTITRGTGSKPWKIRKGGRNGPVVASSTSKRKALASTRARYAAEGKRGRGSR